MQNLPITIVSPLADLLVSAAQRYPDSDALICPPAHLSYEALHARVIDIARGLLALGVRRGDRIGLLMPNCAEFVEVVLASAMVGGVFVPINARFRIGELRFVVPHADVSVIFTSDIVAEQVDHASRLIEAFPELDRSASGVDLHLAGAPRLRAAVLLGNDERPGFMSQQDFDRLGQAVDVADVESRRALVRLRDRLAILYTSGTTAHPKGCEHTHEALVRNALETGRTRFLLTPEDRFWDPLPMYHVGGLIPMIAALDAGAAFVSMTHFDGGTALDQIEAERATWLFPAFPAIADALLDDASFPARELGQVRMTMCVGPPAALRRLQNALPQAIQISTYGSTETGGVITYHVTGDDADVRATTCGPPLRGIELAVAGPDGSRLAENQVGEILVRGYSVTDGYYKDATATEISIDEDGWLHTGDLGSLNEAGYLTFAGRLKDMLKVGGENVAALEVEALLAEHPSVLVAQVVAAPDERLGEAVAAFIELRPGVAPLSAAELTAHCQGRLASFKMPRHIRFVSSWPMSATKIQKHVLRGQIESELSREAGTPPNV